MIEKEISLTLDYYHTHKITTTDNISKNFLRSRTISGEKHDLIDETI